MNDVALRNSTALAQQTEDPFADLVREEGSRSIRGTLLKFDKGDWIAGQDNTEIPAGTKLVAHIPELMRGWVRWESNKPTDHIMGKVYDRFQMPRREELGDHDQSRWEVDNNGKARDPWQKTYYLLLLGIENEDLYTFAASSKGGTDAVLDLCDAYSRGKRKQKGDVLPVIALGGSSYMHPTRELGRIKTPVFKLVSWAPATVFDDALGGAAEEIDPETGEVKEKQEQIPF